MLLASLYILPPWCEPMAIMISVITVYNNFKKLITMGKIYNSAKKVWNLGGRNKLHLMT